MKVLVSLLLLFVSLPLAAQTEPAVLEIRPGAVPSSGNVVVRIRMTSLPNCPILPPGPPTVTFGTHSVAATPYGDDTLLVQAPPHAAGPVDLKIEACGMETIVIPNGFGYFTQGPSIQQFYVTGITPAHGPLTGGTEVVFQGGDFPTCSSGAVPTVLFDGAAASSVRQDEEAETITVVTPAHTSGTVNVEIRACGGSAVTLLSGFTFADGDNPNPAYEQVLFPVFFFGPGAFGSEWATRISVLNAGESDVTAATPLFVGGPACPAVCGCGPIATLQPGRSAEVCGTYADQAGVIGWFPRLAEDDLHYQARVYDTSRSTMNAGTEIRAVREREFRTDEIVLQDLPLDEHFRLALRLYELDQTDGAQIRMEILDPSDGETLGEQILTLSYPIVHVQPDEYPNRPAFLLIGNFDSVVRQLIGAASITRFNVKLTPVTEGIRFWSIASITNNETQLITTITPQH